MSKLNLPDATQLLQKIKEGKLNSEIITKEYLNRLNENHSKVNGATQIFAEEALNLAKNPKAGPLSGIPISVKETFGIAGEVITAGSVRMPVIQSQEDSVIVKKIKNAGAIILARSNIPEFAMNPETGNLRFGQTNNPINPEHIAGGSSGGEGALVGSGSTVFGLGSDIGGSIRIPAHCCGVVGFKPASHAVDKTGTFPEVTGYTNSMLALGPITRSVRDARMVYNIIADNPLGNPGKTLGLRLLVPGNFQMKIQQSCIKKALKHSESVLKNCGMSKEAFHCPEVPSLYLNLVSLVIHDFEKNMHTMLTTAEGKKFRLIPEFFRQLFGKPTIYKGLFQMLIAMPFVRPSKKKVENAKTFIDSAREKYHKILGKDGILILPTVGTLASKHGKMNKIVNRPGVVKVFTPTTFCNILNLPAISIPAWKFPDPDTGLVPGIMLACAPGSETALFDAALELEKEIS